VFVQPVRAEPHVESVAHSSVSTHDSLSVPVFVSVKPEKQLQL
jgi:hypothetical protein